MWSDGVPYTMAVYLFWPLVGPALGTIERHEQSVQIAVASVLGRRELPRYLSHCAETAACRRTDVQFAEEVLVDVLPLTEGKHATVVLPASGAWSARQVGKRTASTRKRVARCLPRLSQGLHGPAGRVVAS